MESRRELQIHATRLLARAAAAKQHATNETIFSQADPADALFYIQKGKIKLTVVSSRAKVAVIAILGAGDFFGEACLARQPVRMSSAITLCECALVRLEKTAALDVIRKEPAVSEFFLHYILSRNIRIEEELINQLFNCTEKRLARVLLLFANFGKEGKPQPAIPKMSQDTLAEMVGTTRSRISFLMNRFRKMGFIDYKKGLEVHSSLLSVLLRD
jgi:CRP/FNR family cyclic AMP-dependent transcriptional regulator